MMIYLVIYQKDIPIISSEETNFGQHIAKC